MSRILRKIAVAVKKGTGCVVLNSTQVKIAVAGETPEDPDNTTSIWVWPGQSTQGKLLDADAVVIAPGQQFYKSLATAILSGDVVTSGAFKIANLQGTVEVRASSRRPDIFYVNAIGAWHCGAAEARHEGWVEP